MSELVDDLRRSAASNLRQAESSVRQGGPTAFVGEAYSLRKAADLHSKAADELDAKDAIIAELAGMVKDFAKNSPRNVWPMHPSAVDTLLARVSKASQD